MHPLFAGRRRRVQFRMRECPLCGESMRLSVREVQDVNGTIRQIREWICPECDYFEEAETEG